jgi:hypothetical protein
MENLDLFIDEVNDPEGMRKPCFDPLRHCLTVLMGTNDYHEWSSGFVFVVTMLASVLIVMGPTVTAMLVHMGMLVLMFVRMTLSRSIPAGTVGQL